MTIQKILAVLLVFTQHILIAQSVFSGQPNLIAFDDNTKQLAVIQFRDSKLSKEKITKVSINKESIFVQIKDGSSFNISLDKLTKKDKASKVFITSDKQKIANIYKDKKLTASGKILLSSKGFLEILNFDCLPEGADSKCQSGGNGAINCSDKQSYIVCGESTFACCE